MTINLTEITPVDPIDFTGEEMKTGDQGAFIEKMERYMTKLEAWSAQLHTQTSNVVAMRDDVIALLESFSTTLGESETNNTEFQNQVTNTVNNVVAITDTTNASAQEAQLAVTEAVEEVNKMESSLLIARNSALNLTSDNGTFLNTDGSEWAVTNPVQRDDGFTDLFDSYNGSTLSLFQRDRWHYDSETYGGSGPAISSLMERWTNEMEIYKPIIGSKRWARPWMIGETIAGSGVNGLSYEGCYQMLTTGKLGLNYGPENAVSLSFWFESMDVGAYFKGHSETADRALYINGVRKGDTDGHNGSSFHRIEPWRVVHVAVSHSLLESTTTVNNFILSLLVEPLSRQRWGMIRVAPGAFQLLPHSMPIKSLV